MLRLFVFGVTVFAGLASVADAAVVVANSVADAEEHVFEGNSMDLGSSDLELITEGAGGLDWQVIGLQYNSLGIERLSTINNAFMTFTVDPGGVDLEGTMSLTVFGELAPNAAAITATAADLTSRVRTAARVSWNLSTTNPTTNAPWQPGQTFATPNLAPIIQELVNQTGWLPNSQLTLLIAPQAYLTDPNAAAFVLPEIETASRDNGDAQSFTPLTVDFTAVPEPNSALAVFLVAGVASLVRRRKS